MFQSYTQRSSTPGSLSANEDHKMTEKMAENLSLRQLLLPF